MVAEFDIKEFHVRGCPGAELDLGVYAIEDRGGVFGKGVAMAPGPAPGVLGAPEVVLEAGDVLELDLAAVGEQRAGEAGVEVGDEGLGFGVAGAVEEFGGEVIEGGAGGIEGEVPGEREFLVRVGEGGAAGVLAKLGVGDLEAEAVLVAAEALDGEAVFEGEVVIGIFQVVEHAP